MQNVASSRRPQSLTSPSSKELYRSVNEGLFQNVRKFDSLKFQREEVKVKEMNDYETKVINQLLNHIKI